MTESDHKKEPGLPAIILNRNLSARLHAQLVEDQYAAHGSSYDFEREYPNLPGPPDQKMPLDIMMVARYRAATITKLMREGKVEYESLKEEFPEMTAPQEAFRRMHQVALRRAYQWVLNLMEDPDKLPKVKKEDS